LQELRPLEDGYVVVKAYKLHQLDISRAVHTHADALQQRPPQKE
jgi:hypothetical protein